MLYEFSEGSKKGSLIMSQRVGHREKTALSGRENGFLYETKRLSLVEKTFFLCRYLTYSLFLSEGL